MRRLLGDIARGVFREGDRLPSETELMGQFSASRGVVRETLRGLEERGVISVRHGSGATVRPMADWNLLDVSVLSSVVETGDGAAVLSEFLECRKILEVEAAALAAERATSADVQRLADAISRMRATAQLPEWTETADELFHEADVEFHNAIFVAAGNRVLSRVVEPIQRALHTAQRPLAHREVRLERAVPEHEAILSAITTRQSDSAREAMSAHLATIEMYLREFEERVARTQRKT